ncbi:MAG: hypothetical protein SVM86_00205 [Candidatus Cloacimonadota bacterium]|nr:hypothetical protein [Candidatus Cloacimonadota bacterium]
MKKILLITYYWPPSGGPGVQRWLKFVKYLPQYGWQPTIITTKDGDYPAYDASLEADIPNTTKIIRTFTPKLSKLFSKISGNSSMPYGSLKISDEKRWLNKVLIFIRLNFIVPDIRIIWNHFAYKAAYSRLLSSNFDLLVSTGPPHSTHLVAAKLVKKFRIKWLADFRDPWSNMGYIKSSNRFALTEYLDKRLEKKVVKNSNVITAVSQKIIDDFNNKEKIKLLRNGFDEADFSQVTKKQSSHFNINYFGSLTNDTDPTIIVEAINRLIKKGCEKLALNFWGKHSLQIKEKILSLDTYNIIKFMGFLPHSKVLEEMVNSQLLLLIINKVKNNEGILTGKIFEYLGSKNPILGIGPERGEAAEILRETGFGEMFDYNDNSAIENYIENLFDNWKKGNTWSPPHNSYLRYSRKQLTKKLVQIIK